MSIREELHTLVDQLDDVEASEALTYLRHLAREDEGVGETTTALAHRMRPRTLSGHAFFARHESHPDLHALAAQQGAQPVERFSDLLGDFWPEDETADQFVAAVRQWRREGGHA